MGNQFVAGFIASTVLLVPVTWYLTNQNGQANVEKWLKRFSKNDVACISFSHEGESGAKYAKKLGAFDGLDNTLNPFKNGRYDPAPLMATCAISGSKKKELITQLPDKGISQSLTLWADSPWGPEKQPATVAMNVNKDAPDLNLPPSIDKQ